MEAGTTDYPTRNDSALTLILSLVKKIICGPKLLEKKRNIFMASLWEIISSKNKSTNYNGKGLQIWLYFKKPSYSSKDTINK